MSRVLSRARHGLVVVLLGLAGCSGAPSASAPASTSAPVVPATLGPRLVIKSTAIDAGEVEFGDPKDYIFRLENVGDQPLKLTVHSVFCSCAAISVPPEVAPQAMGEVKIRWAPSPGVLGTVWQPTVLKTNDPTKPTLNLEIKAAVNPRIRLSPASWHYIDFDQLVAGRSEKRTMTVYSTRVKSFGLTAALRDGREPPAYQASVTPLEAGAVVDDQKILAGYSVDVKTIDDPPRGYLPRELVLSVSIPNEPAREIVVPVYGKLENGIFKAAPEEIEFQTRNLADGEERKAVVTFLVPTPHEKVEVVRCEPSFLQVDPPQLATPGQNGRWIITIRIPKNNADALRFQPEKHFDGAVYLKVSGSERPVTVRVKWNYPEK